MAAPVLMIGFYPFMPIKSSFEAFERNRKFEWKPQSRLMRRPAMQFTGIGQDSITITGTWFNELTPNNERIADIIAMQASLRLPLPVLRFGTRKAKFYGLWVITSIKEKHDFLDHNGQFQKTGYTIGLENFGLDFGGWM